MAFELLAASVINAGAATNADCTFPPDPDFSVRNNHLITTEPYELWCDFIDGATVTRGRYQCPTWNAIGETIIFPPNNGAAVVPSNPQVGFYMNYPLQLPQNEEFQVQITCTAAETDYWLGIIAPPNQSRNIPMGSMPIVIRATASVAKTLNTWSGGGAITLAQSLKGGVYALVGCQVFCANALAFRIIFPRTSPRFRRKMRPGWLCQNAVADLPEQFTRGNPYLFGTWGFFHTFELPSVEVYGNVAGAATQEIRMWLVYMGTDVSQLDSLLQAG